MSDFATIGSMLESVQVTSEKHADFNQYRVRWRGLDGRLCIDSNYVAHSFIRDWGGLPDVTLMATGILTAEHGGRLAALVYLMVDRAGEVVARIKRVPDMDPDEGFVLKGGLPIDGPGVHPLPITELPPLPPEDDKWAYLAKQPKGFA
jgi:hypothetical protein